MSIEQGPNNPINTESHQWDKVAALADKMGKIEDGREPILEHKQQEAIDYLIHEFANLKNEEDFQKIQQEFEVKSEGLWSRDYAINAFRRFHDEFIPNEPYKESDAWNLIEFGMPSEIILKNEDFYQEMIGKKPQLNLDTIIEFSHAMCGTEEGVTKFRHDFIENGMYTYDLEEKIKTLFKQGKLDESTLSDLKILKQFGVNLFDACLPLPDLPDLFDDDYATKLKEANSLIYRSTKYLIDNNLLDSSDYTSVIKMTLDASSFGSNGKTQTSVLDAMLDSGLEPKSDDKDADYWLKLSQESGQNMLKNFIYGNAEDRQANYDFTNESIMKAFVVLHRHHVDVESYQTPQFREALKQTAFQKTIMQEIATQDQTSDLPKLFLLLAQDQDVLGSMQSSGIFDQYPECKSIGLISKFASGNYTEQDRLSLFLPDGIIGSKSFGKLFDENGEPNLRFYSEHSQFLENVSYCLSPDEQEKLKAVSLLPSAIEAYRNKKYDGLDPTIKDFYFDESGPKPEFWQASFYMGELDMLCQQDEDTINNVGFDENQLKVLNICRALPDKKSRAFLSDYVLKSDGEIPVDKIEMIPELLDKLRSSNAEEVSNHYAEFANMVLRSSLNSMEEANVLLGKIEDVFIHNNLPYVGKVFKTFQLLYPEDQSFKVSSALERGALKGRPFLPDANELTIPHNIEDFKKIAGSKETILFGDLLKASMNSNNRDLRNYLISLQSGAELTERAIAGETEFSEKEQETLKVYAEHLRTILENTQTGKANPPIMTGNILEDVKQLADKFSPTSRYSVPDRIVRSFGFMLGIRGCDEMIERMEHATSAADARNRAAAERGEFKLEPGDLLKATGVEYLGSILQNGSVSKEFLNGERDSDSTPLDSDLNILPESFNGSISDGIEHKNQLAAFGAMHCIIVMKGDVNSGRNRFAVESENGIYDPNKYEIWHNGSESYGIRVGFPSTEIDYLIWDNLGQQDSRGDLERMKHEVVKNGFYIPIVDKNSGQLIFTPEDYDLARQKMSGLESLGGAPFIPADSHERALVPSLSLEAYTFPDGTTIEGTAETIAKSQDNQTEVNKKRNTIIESVFDPVLEKFGLARKDYFDGDLTEGSAEIIDTGSTGRYSNAPGDGDFDFMMKLDRKDFTDSTKRKQILNAFCDILGLSADAVKGGNIRAKHVLLPGLDEPVDIDITFAVKTNKVRYSTDVALKEFYASMTPEKKEEVVANVVFAKRFLKAAEAYKANRGETPQGGLGGVGIENWVLQSGGSFLAAAREFMQVANECGDNFEAFKGKYAVFDYGQNHQGGEYDDFVVSNMSKEGYDKMRQALREYLAQIKT